MASVIAISLNPSDKHVIVMAVMRHVYACVCGQFTFSRLGIDRVQAWLAVMLVVSETGKIVLFPVSAVRA